MNPRANALYTEHLDQVRKRADRVFACLMIVQWVAGVVLSLVYTPTTWDGARDRVHPHLWAALLLGGAISGLPVALASARPGRVLTRHVVAAGQMLTSALLIHLSGGRIETHFHVFGSLAFIAYYRDWAVLLTATVVVAADHAARGLWWPESVYGVAYASAWRWVEHAFWVVFEDVILLLWCIAGLKEMREIAHHQARLEEQQRQIVESQRLAKEMEIASNIQTSILPRQTAVEGLQIAARMLPASEVGGDYYEVLPVADGCWLGIGDVSGHGLTSGLVMLMIQSAVASLGRHSPNATPRELLVVLNELLFDNIRRRMADDNHATLSLLRYRRDGEVVFAGAHEDILVLRRDGRVERVGTPGPWVGACRSIQRSAVDSSTWLAEGDVMVLYTDGVTEAKNAQGEQFGIDRLCAELSSMRGRDVGEIRDALLSSVQRWSSRQDDDVTLMVLRRAGASS